MTEELKKLLLSIRCSEEMNSLDDVCTWLRENYNIVIYDAIEPFLDPTTKTPVILFRKKVKWCNVHMGWNGRVLIACSKLTDDAEGAIYECIVKGIKYVISKKLKPYSQEG